MIRTLLNSIVLCISLTGLSQDIEVNSYVSKNEVKVNEIFTFEITYSPSCTPSNPNLGGLQVMRQPFRTSGTQILNNNGKVTKKVEYKVTYQIRAIKEGSYTIAPVVFNCNNKSYKTKPITINAVKSSGQNSNLPTNSDFFVRMHASKNLVYQGEPFTVTLKMYSKNQPQNLENVEFGESKGIWRKDLNPKQTTFNSSYEVINGIRYFTTTIRTELCYAQTNGNLTIERAAISAIFRRGFFQSYRREAKSNNIKIKVKPLPRNAPKNFNGLVGQFKLEHDISKTTLNPGEAIDFKIKITGKGNLNAFDDPQLNIPNDFEQFDPEVKPKLNYKSSGIEGSIAYNYVLVPTFYGDYNIPAYSFSYFDLETKTYQSLSTGDLDIEVLKTDGSIAKSQDVTSKKDVNLQNEDIRFILNSDDTLFLYSDFLIVKPLYFGLLCCPFLILGGIYFIRKRNGTSSQKMLRAKKTLNKRTQQLINEAEGHHQSGNDKLALETLNSCFKVFTQDKLQLSTSEMTLSQINDLLNSKEFDEQSISKFNRVWETLDLFQYAPVTAEKVGELIKDTRIIITTLNQKL